MPLSHRREQRQPSKKDQPQRIHPVNWGTLGFDHAADTPHGSIILKVRFQKRRRQEITLPAPIRSSLTSMHGAQSHYLVSASWALTSEAPASTVAADAAAEAEKPAAAAATG